MTALGGRASEVVDRINSDPAFVTSIARLMVVGIFEPSTSQKLARSIMDKNFLGVEEAIIHLGVSPTEQQLAFLAEVPWSEEVLHSCKDTHILVAVFPMSILDIRAKVAKNQTKLFYSQNWYDKQTFAGLKGKVGWQLVRKEPIPDSTGKNWIEQQALLSKDEEIPTVQVMVYTVIGHFLSTGERLFKDVYVYTGSPNSDGDHVNVGYFDLDGLRVSNYFDGYREDDLGVVSSKQ